MSAREPAALLQPPAAELSMTDITVRRGAAFATLVILIAIVGLVAALAGCAIDPHCVQPDTPVAASFAGASRGLYSDGDAQARFWMQRGDAAQTESSTGEPLAATSLIALYKALGGAAERVSLPHYVRSSGG